MNRIFTAAEAVRVVRDGATLATSDFVGIGFPEELAIALEQRFLESSRAVRRATSQSFTPPYKVMAESVG